jgi:hypothetical protein
MSSDKRKVDGAVEESHTKKPRSANGGAGALEYLSGFGAELHSEALAGALPKDQNNPQKYCNDVFTNIFIWNK